MSRYRDFGSTKRGGGPPAPAATPAAQANDATPETLPPTSDVQAVNGQNGRRWSITGEFIYDGFCYRISRRPISNDAEVDLTAREDEVLSYLERGLTNKEIAVRLGVSASTVGVLVFRAASKLRVKTRAELVSAYAELKLLRRTR